MKNTIELAAEFIHRAAFVDANALLKDECGAEGLYKSREEFRKWSDDWFLWGPYCPALVCPPEDSWTA